MFKKPTVLIVGAGASSEFGLPGGLALRNTIADSVRFRFEHGFRLTKGDPRLLEWIRKKCNGEVERSNEYTKAGNDLASTLDQFASIDEALHYWSARPEIVELGKLAIAMEILKAEAHSSIAAKSGLSMPPVENASGTWLAETLKIAIAGQRREDVPNLFANLSVINFNYDRSLEYYLYWALQQHAAVSKETARISVSSLHVIRPYGFVGNLEWQGDAGVPFGGIDHRGSLFEIADRIHTYTEQRHDTSIETEIDHVLEEARLVIFLGFGYHAQNMTLFIPKTGSTRSKNQVTIGTVMGLSPHNLSTLRQSISTSIGLKPGEMLDLKCAQFLNNLRPMISTLVG